MTLVVHDIPICLRKEWGQHICSLRAHVDGSPTQEYVVPRSTLTSILVCILERHFVFDTTVSASSDRCGIRSATRIDAQIGDASTRAHRRRCAASRILATSERLSLGANMVSNELHSMGHITGTHWRVPEGPRTPSAPALRTQRDTPCTVSGPGVAGRRRRLRPQRN